MVTLADGNYLSISGQEITGYCSALSSGGTGADDGAGADDQLQGVMDYSRLDAKHSITEVCNDY